MPRTMFSMQQILLIFFIYQWVTRTTLATREFTTTTKTTKSETTTTPPSTQSTTSLPTIVSSSEATLLTRNSFPAIPITMSHNFFSDTQGRNKAALTKTNTPPSSSSPSSVEDSTESNNNINLNNNFQNRYEIVALKTNCTRDLFEIDIDLNRDFHGLLYTKDFPLECRTRGTAKTNIKLKIPTSRCGIRGELQPDGNMELSVQIMLQMEKKLRQSSDILKTVRCKLPFNAMSMTVTSKENNKLRQHNYRNGRTFDNKRKQKSRNNQQKSVEYEEEKQNKTTETTTSTPRVRIWLELGNKDGSGTVEVGEETRLTVRANLPAKIGVMVGDCSALDGLGESVQKLLDDRGCPIDEQVMPSLQSSLKPTEEGWSKHDENELIEKAFTAAFPAFKFPDRERLHVSCGVQLCKGPCPVINCRSEEPLILSTDKHLARIEVFNSLAVTAPQIEVDRLRYDRRYNISADEYPPYVRLPAEGILCMSISKLAISFCVLGLIFLAAIFIAICSLIRSRRRTLHDAATLTSNASRIHRTEISTSMFSSSSGDSTQTTRFGSKFLMPYYPNANLPYGRVY